MTFHPVANRRQLLVSAGLGWLGLTPAALRTLRAASPPTSHQTEKRQRNSCIFLFLFGGPSHIDLWDMKPDAPDTVRGELTPTATVVPGIRTCEHLPRFGRVMDRVCLLSSVTHQM